MAEGGLERRLRAGGTAATALLLVLAACTAEAPAPRVETPVDSASGEIAFDLAGPGGAAVVVPVLINGQGPYEFALDTGATLTCIDQALAKELGLSEERGVRGIGAGMGTAGRISLVRADSVRVGGARVDDIMLCAIDLKHIESVGLDIEGLLGLNFLKSFRMTLDFERDVLLLRTP